MKEEFVKVLEMIKNHSLNRDGAMVAISEITKTYRSKYSIADIVWRLYGNCLEYSVGLDNSIKNLLIILGEEK